jgi:hypothetical protein
MVRVSITLMVLGYGSVLLNLINIHFIILAWADNMQPWAGLIIGTIGLLFLLVPLLLARRGGGSIAPAQPLQQNYGFAPAPQQPYGTPAQGFPQQQGFGQQGSAQQNPQQGFASQQGFGQQGSAQQNPQQGFAPQQTGSQQGFAPQPTGAQQAFPPQTGAQQGFPSQPGFAPQQPGPQQGFPPPQQAFPSQQFPHTGPQQAAPHQFPPQGYGPQQ